MVLGCIKKANLHLEKLMAHIQTIDNEEESEDDAMELSNNDNNNKNEGDGEN